jgi:hypothetical protein
VGSMVQRYRYVLILCAIMVVAMGYSFFINAR